MIAKHLLSATMLVMQRLLASVVLSLILAVAPSLARADNSAEDEYVVIFNTIQDADALKEASKAGAAAAKYQEAQQALIKFPDAFPDWYNKNSRIVEFRLNYVAEKIRLLQGTKPPAETPKPAPVAKTTTPTPSTPAISTTDIENKIKALQADIQKVAAEKSALESKVNELSTASASGTGQLSAAQEKIKLLEKQNEDLKTGLEEQKAKSSQLVEATVLAEGKKALAEANQKLAAEKDAVSTLQKEKETLQRSLNSLNAAKKSDVELDQTKQALTEANRKFIEQSEAVKTLTKQKDALQKNLESVSKASASATELESVRKELGEATKTIAQQTETVKSLARDKETLKKDLEDAKAALAIVKPATESAELKSLQERLKQVEAEKVSLEAKLKESLAARPAATDSRELAKAGERIRELEKENQLLKTSIEERQANLLKSTDSGVAALEQMKKDLVEARQRLATQNQAAVVWAAEKEALEKKIQGMSDMASQLETLRAENTAVRKQLEEARQSDSLAVLKQAESAMDELNGKLAKQVEISRTLAAEKEVLQQRLDAMAKSGDYSKELEQTRRALVAANRKLEIQSEAAAVLLAEANMKLERQLQAYAELARDKDALRAENELLKKQAAKKSSGKSDTAAARKLAEAQAQLAALQSDKKMLEMEKAALERQLKRKGAAAATSAAPSAEESEKIKQLELERALLERKLQEATKELNSRSGSSNAADLANQVSSLRSRLNVLEAQPVPYTKEELALFQQSNLKLAGKPAARTAKDLSSNAKKLLTDAKHDFAAKDFDKAEAKYMKVLREDPQNLYVLANLASIQLELNKDEDAEANLKKALALDPNDVYTLNIYGNAKFRQKDYDTALDALSHAAKIQPENAEVQNILGITLSHKGMRGPAETALRKAIQIDPNFASAHNNLAVIYASQTPPLTELARWHYQKAVASGGGHNAQLEKLLEESKASTASVNDTNQSPKQ